MTTTTANRYQRSQSRIVRDVKTFMNTGHFDSYHIPDGEQSIIEEYTEDEYGAGVDSLRATTLVRSVKSVKSSGTVPARRDRVRSNASMFGVRYPSRSTNMRRDDDNKAMDAESSWSRHAADLEKELLENPDYKYFASPI